MGCCVSTSAGADDAGPSASSRGFSPAFDDASTRVFDDDDLPFADGDELADVVRDVFAELDPALRRALAPSLRRTRGKRLGDDYDESDAELIGKGAFSVVYLVRHRPTGGSFAAKIISTKGTTPDRRRDHIRALLCEAGVAAAAAHDTIVAFRDVFFEPDRAVLVQEYCHGGTLLRTVQRQVDRKRSERRAAGARAAGDVRRERSRSRLGGVGADPGGADPGGADPGGADPYPATPEEEDAKAAAAAAVMAASGGALRERDAVVAVRRVAEALAHLHAAGYVHRDVKLENLLLAVPGDLRTLKLADFGFAVASASASASASAGGRRSAAFARRDRVGDKLRGTVEYAAPEVLANLSRGGGGGGGDAQGRKNRSDDGAARSTPSRSTPSRSTPSRSAGDSEDGDRTSRVVRGSEHERASASARPAVDVWSFGVTAFLMLGGYHPFDASREAYSARLRMDVTLQREFAKPAWTSISPEAKRVLRAMLKSEASERVAVDELLRDPWLAAADIPRSPSALPLRVPGEESPGPGRIRIEMGARARLSGSPASPPRSSSPTRVSPRADEDEEEDRPRSREAKAKAKAATRMVPRSATVSPRAVPREGARE